MKSNKDKIDSKKKKTVQIQNGIADMIKAKQTAIDGKKRKS